MTAPRHFLTLTDLSGSELKQLIKSSPLKTESLILLNSVVLEDRMA